MVEQAVLRQGAVEHPAAFRAALLRAVPETRPANPVASLLVVYPDLREARIAASQAHWAHYQSWVFDRFAREIRIVSP